MTAWAVGGIFAVHMLVCVCAQVVPGRDTVGTTPGFFWGTFLYLWVLVTFIQWVVCSVYVCNPVGMLCSIVDMCVVIVASLIPRDLFAQQAWLGPLLCAVFVSHQGHMFWLVYAHISNRSMCIVALVLGVLLPLTQLFYSPGELSPDSNTTPGMSVGDLTVSVISVAILYTAAVFNCYGAVVVDVTIGVSPLWTVGDTD